ncbi:MAG: tetratricopeptide repeat protein [Verrucomicrobia bacterium]|nr:tetratricopeptide repeat protein [Verrucomicrobiota bacterium]
MTVSPAKIQQQVQEALAHQRAGRHVRANAILQQLLALAPRHAGLHDLMGQLAAQQGRSEEAIRCFRLAVREDERCANHAVRLALALTSAGQTAEAERVLRRLLQLTPQSAEGWNVLGFVLKTAGRLKEAAECHEHAVQRDPNFVEGWYHYAHTLASAGCSLRSLAPYERALALNPRHEPARFGRAQALHKVLRLDEAVQEYDRILAANPAHHEARSCRLWARQSVEGLSREERWKEHQAYGAAVGVEVKPARERMEPEPGRRLRLGILSPDLREHSCSYFLEPLLPGLGPAGFDLFLYHDHPCEDAVSARLRSHAVGWRNLAGRSLPDAERILRGDRPDLMIDLAGHLGTTLRLPLFARRLAPVQITYLGYPDTTGVAAMDFRFTDAVADPPGETDRFHSERLVRFAPTAWAYQPPAGCPDVSPPPSAPDHAVCFGCFNSPTKFTDTQFALWARILERVEGARLLLKGRDFEEAAVREALRERLRSRGVPLERVELLSRTATTAEHLATYARVDIALDTFPYNGTTTTCEALWMGRPVITRCGDRHAARVGSSLLQAVGHPECVAHSDDAWVETAVQWATDREGRVRLAANLRSEMAASPLMDHRRQAERFALALRECWRLRAQEGVRAA